MAGFRRFTRAGIVALAASFGFGALSDANAHPSTGAGPGMDSGAAKGLRLSVEGVIPVVQDLDGPQLEREYTVLIELKKTF